jgi:hypothetical protein
MPSVLSLALLLLLTLPAAAQPAPTPPSGPAADAVLAPEAPAVPSRLSDQAVVSLVTAMPGEEVWQLFGHTFLRVRDPETRLDRTYNYGTFDFAQPYFVLRFARGQLDYTLTTPPYARTEPGYIYERRGLIEQTLDLTPAEAQRLYALLETNALPGNREYRYDFFFDNCSTRPLDMLEAALGTRLVAPSAAGGARTFRDLIQPYLHVHPLTDFGIDLALGLPTDDVATERQTTFLPLELLDALDDARLDGRPLVSRTDTLFWMPPISTRPAAFDWPLWLGWALFGVGLLVSVREARRGFVGRGRVDGLLFWTVGLAGVVIFLLWTATEHPTTGPNLNLLWAWPTHAVFAVALARGSEADWLKRYGWVAGIATLLVALAWPLWPQALPAPALPLALLLALRLLVRARFPQRSA